MNYKFNEKDNIDEILKEFADSTANNLFGDLGSSEEVMNMLNEVDKIQEAIDKEVGSGSVESVVGDNSEPIIEGGDDAEESFIDAVLDGLVTQVTNKLSERLDLISFQLAELADLVKKLVETSDNKALDSPKEDEEASLRAKLLEILKKKGIEPPINPKDKRTQMTILNFAQSHGLSKSKTEQLVKSLK